MMFYFPQTIEEAVERLMKELSNDDLDKIKNMKEEDLIMLHFGLGQGIRNSYGLWADNKALLKSCGGEDMQPDDASSAIINFLWITLRQEK
ncbi:MAG: hypothetical protein ISS11_08185 [Candidatus Marinimicrobia bacterium]|nr:hypothetical protein [Candidatus Neomarinimicrobiota bacterium]